MQRLNIQLEDKVYERIRALAFQTDTSITEVIRQCIDVSIDAVEIKLISGCEGKLMMNPEYFLRLNTLASVAAERSQLSSAKPPVPPTQEPKPEEPKR